MRHSDGARFCERFVSATALVSSHPWLRYAIAFVAMVAITGCHSNQKASGTEPAGAPLSVSDVAFDDIDNIPERQYIVDLARLNVFDATSGHFNPATSISRGDYSRWLFKANNAIWWDHPSFQIRPAEGRKATFRDVPASDANFVYIQGFNDAGFAIGFDDKYFHPNAALTHEQLLAIKESVDRGGYDHYMKSTAHAGEPTGLDHVTGLPDWKDIDQVKPEFRPLIATLVNDDHQTTTFGLFKGRDLGTIGRTFGSIAMLRPTEPVTRAQAAASLWKIGTHSTPQSIETPGPRTAAEAIAAHDATPSPSPSPTP